MKSRSTSLLDLLRRVTVPRLENVRQRSASFAERNAKQPPEEVLSELTAVEAPRPIEQMVQRLTNWRK